MRHQHVTPMTSPADMNQIKEIMEPKSIRCRPLIEIATPDLVRNNAFRITGLPVDATTREISKQADKVKMMDGLVEGLTISNGVFSKSAPPSVDQTREAFQRIKDPELRLIDEFLWFWPLQPESNQPDSSLQALGSGDLDSALKHWTALETDPIIGVIAMHNVALVYHFSALEMEDRLLAMTAFADAMQQDREKLWRSAFKRWDLLLADDLLWERVILRIRQLDDPRLTTGFARRMRATLPIALAKLNALLAVRYAEAKRNEDAKVHVQLMREVSQTSTCFRETSQLAIEQTVSRLRLQINRAQERADKNPSDALNAACVLVDHARDAIALIGLFFDEKNDIAADLSDDVAGLCNRLQVIYHKATGDNTGCQALLEIVRPLAVSSELKKQIEENIAILKGNVAQKRLDPLLAALRGIVESVGEPKAKCERIRLEIVPALAELIRKEGADSEVACEFSDTVAHALRGLSIDANNDYDDSDTALVAITSAWNLARDPALKERLAADKNTITGNVAASEKNNLVLKIRSDEIEITREKVRYNSQVLHCKDIQGIRFGIFARYTNGAKSSVSYLIAICDSRGGVVNLECKRFFRSEDQAKADYQAILGSLFYHVVPSLCSRIAQSIVDGGRTPFGNCYLAEHGVQGETGALFWKEAFLLPWDETHADCSGGYLHLRTYAGGMTLAQQRRAMTGLGQRRLMDVLGDPIISKDFSLRDVWNAVIFEEIAKKVVELKNKRAKPN